MTLAVMQPYFLPYLGHFSMVHAADHYIFFDTVQYTRKSWMSRNRILKPGRHDWHYIIAGLQKPAYQVMFHEVLLQPDGGWKEVIRAQLKHYKNHAPFFAETMDLIDQVFNLPTNTLATFNMQSTIHIARYLEINTPFSKLSDAGFAYQPANNPADWALNVSLGFGAEKYVNAPGGENLLAIEKFAAAGLPIGFIQPILGPYMQANDSFIPGLSILDVLMWNGRAETAELVKQYSVKWHPSKINES